MADSNVVPGHFFFIALVPCGLACGQQLVVAQRSCLCAHICFFMFESGPKVFTLTHCVRIEIHHDAFAAMGPFQRICVARFPGKMPKTSAHVNT